MSMRQFARRFTKKSEPKYQNKSSLCSLNHSHRSKLESALCEALRLRERAGEISDLQAEVRVFICGPEGHECDHKRKIESIVDFRWKNRATGEWEYGEAKGYVAPAWPLKRRLWLHYRTERLEVWKGDYRRPTLDEVLNG